MHNTYSYYSSYSNRPIYRGPIYRAIPFTGDLSFPPKLHFTRNDHSIYRAILFAVHFPFLERAR